jgi:hypothetical protein
MIARQVLYHLSQSFSPFLSGYFGNRVLLFAQVSLDLNLPIFFLFPPFIPLMMPPYLAFSS